MGKFIDERTHVTHKHRERVIVQIRFLRFVEPKIRRAINAATDAHSLRITGEEHVPGADYRFVLGEWTYEARGANRADIAAELAKTLDVTIYMELSDRANTVYVARRGVRERLCLCTGPVTSSCLEVDDASEQVT